MKYGTCLDLIFFQVIINRQSLVVMKWELCGFLKHADQSLDSLRRDRDDWVPWHGWLNGFMVGQSFTADHKLIKASLTLFEVLLIDRCKVNLDIESLGELLHVRVL